MSIRCAAFSWRSVSGTCRGATMHRLGRTRVPLRGLDGWIMKGPVVCSADRVPGTPSGDDASLAGNTGVGQRRSGQDVSVSGHYRPAACGHDRSGLPAHMRTPATTTPACGRLPRRSLRWGFRSEPGGPGPSPFTWRGCLVAPTREEQPQVARWWCSTPSDSADCSAVMILLLATCDRSPRGRSRTRRRLRRPCRGSVRR
jgi:hypothetical protein